MMPYKVLYVNIQYLVRFYTFKKERYLKIVITKKDKCMFCSKEFKDINSHWARNKSCKQEMLFYLNGPKK